MSNDEEEILSKAASTKYSDKIKRTRGNIEKIPAAENEKHEIEDEFWKNTHDHKL